MTCSSNACAPAPSAAASQPLALRHMQAAQASLDAVDTCVASTANLIDRTALGLSVPQYRRTFVQGCACSTGFAGGGCCPSGASSLALQTGCGAHSLMGLAGGAFGALGLYGGIRVMSNSADATAQIRRVQQDLAPQVERLALLESQARTAQLPRTRITEELSALGLWARALGASAREQWFNFWVPGVLQTLAATSAMYTAAQHAGLRLAGPAVGAWMGLAAPALFAAYGLLLAGKHLFELWRAPRAGSAPLGAGDDEAARAFEVRFGAYTQARRQSVARTALAWSLVGTSGVLATLAAAGVWASPLSPIAMLGLSMGAAGFAMWQNSQTRYVPHLPVSPHVSTCDIGTAAQRQTSVMHLGAQDEATQNAATQLLADAPWMARQAHRIERAFRPQCGPSANQVLAAFVADIARGPQRMRVARHTRILLQAATRWCEHEVALMQARLDGAKQRVQQDVQAMQQTLAPSCRHKAARMQQALSGPAVVVHTLNQAAQYLRDDAQSLEGAALRLRGLQACLDDLQMLHRQDMQDVVGEGADASVTGPAQSWLWARLNLLLLSGTLGDAIDKAFIVAHPHLFSQLATPDALPIHNVFVLPAQLEAFAAALLPHIDSGFVHAFYNPRRIEAEIDYLLELESAARAMPDAQVAAPVCTGESCCR